MAILVSKKRLNTMQAWIKRYDDGSEVLQSYNTDVVFKTSSGKYIRLWKGWSMSTMKQVRAYCGLSLRELPFSDGTYEKVARTPKRSGYAMQCRTLVSLPISYWKGIGLKSMIDRVDNHYLKDLVLSYNTAYRKEIKQTYKNNEKILRLFAAMSICVLKGIPKYKNKTIEEERKYVDLAAAAALYDYDFKTLYNTCLKEDYAEFGELN